MSVSFSETGDSQPLTETPSVPGAESDYLECATAANFSVRMHLDAVDGIARDVAEGVKSLPRRGVEIGGLLLGNLRREGGIAAVQVERYQRLVCGHRFG